MATHIYYDTQHTAVTDAEISAATTLLWGANNIIGWKTIRKNKIKFTNGKNMLEISLKNNVLPFILIDSVLKYSNKVFQNSETLQRNAMVNNMLLNPNIIPLNSFSTTGNTSCIFKLHANLINTITSNLSADLMVTLGNFNGKICLILKSGSIINNMVVGNNKFAGVTLASGGVKIPR